jgi:uncharacterized membrane protein YfcA
VVEPLLLYLFAAGIGAVAGLCLGLAGFGWGAVSVPLLILVGVEPSTAIGTVLVTNIVVSLGGSYNHWRNHRANLRLSLLLSLGGLISAVVGALISLGLEPALLTSSLSLYLTVGGVGVLAISSFGSISYRSAESGRAKFLAAGAVPGFFEGAYGSGGAAGILTLILLKVQAHRAVGSWLPATVIVQLAPASLYIATLRIDWLTSLSLLLAGLPAVLLGSQLSGAVSERKLKAGIGVAVLLIGAYLLTRTVFL